MRSIAWTFCVVASIALTSGRAPTGRVVSVSTSEQLMDALRDPPDYTTIRLAPGTYELTMGAGRDSVGLLISGRGVRLEGADPDNTQLVARSSHLSFQDCVDCEIDHVAITVGNGFGAVVVRSSTATITNCIVRAGIYGRAASLLTVEHNEVFVRTSGIDLCDDAHAIMRNNLVQGPGDSTVAFMGLVQVRCDAQAIVERNHLRDFTYGIAIRGNANAEARYNIVEGMSGVGIACDSDTGESARMVIESNVIYQCELSGLALRHSPRSTGSFARNLIVGTGSTNTHRPYRGALVVPDATGGFVVRNNTLFDNATGSEGPDRDVPREMFWRARRKWTRTYRNTPVGVDGRHHFYESAFLTRYGRWLN